MTDSSPSLRFVLMDTWRDLDRFTAAVHRVLENAGAAVPASQQIEERNDIVRTIWNVPEKKLTIEYIADKKVAITWLNLVGDMHSVTLLAEALGEHVRWYTLPMLLVEAERMSPTALVRLALGTNALWDGEVAKRLVVGLQSEQTDVRAAAVEAIYILSWPLLCEDVATALGVERDEGIASMLDLVLQRLLPKNGQSA